jgi:transposase
LKPTVRWCDAPAACEPHKTIYNRFIRWSRLGVFNRIFAELAPGSDTSDRLMIDTTHLKAHSYRCKPAQKALYPAASDRASYRKQPQGRHHARPLTFIPNVIASKTCLPASKTGDASTPGDDRCAHQRHRIAHAVQP